MQPRAGQEFPAILVLRSRNNFLGLSFLDNEAVFHDKKPVAEAAGQFQVMRNEEVGKAVFYLKLL